MTISRVTINATGDAVVLNPPSGSCITTIDRCQIHTTSTTVPVVVGLTNSTIVIDRSKIDGGDGISTYASTCSVTIENSIVTNQNGTDGALWGPGPIHAAFDTFVNTPIKCSSGNVTIVDSILVGNQDVIGPGAGCVANDSILSPQNGAVSGTNDHINIDPLFTNKANRDYSLLPNSPAIDAAPTTAVIPAVDFAGTARPQGPRADLGAFEYKP